MIRIFERLTPEEAAPIKKRLGVREARICENCKYSEEVTNKEGIYDGLECSMSYKECRRSYAAPFLVIADEVCDEHAFCKENPLEMRSKE